jgi:hypothetical protein
MKECQPCRSRWLSWSAFGKHMVHFHNVDREAFWRRANQIGDQPCVAVRSELGRWMLMVQGRLAL